MNVLFGTVHRGASGFFARFNHFTGFFLRSSTGFFGFIHRSASGFFCLVHRVTRDFFGLVGGFFRAFYGCGTRFFDVFGSRSGSFFALVFGFVRAGGHQAGSGQDGDHQFVHLHKYHV